MDEKPQEVDLKKAWGAPLTAIHCAHCDEAHLVPEDDVPTRCPACLRGPVTPQPAYVRDEPPEQVLPYRVEEQQVAQLIEQWAQRIWFRPDDLKPRQLVKRLRRYLIPLWLVDGRIDGPWRADVGFDYQVVSYQDRYHEGAGWDSREVKETRVRWAPRAGRIERAYDNIATPALDDHRAVMSRIGEYDLSKRDSYTPAAVEHADVRVPSLDPEAAWPGAADALVHAAQAECELATNADHIRDFAIEADYSRLHWTLLLLPAYTTWYEEGGQVWPVVINGQTGKVNGVRRASARKANVAAVILGIIGGLLFGGGGVIALLGAILPPAGLIGAIALVIGLLIAIAAPIPAISVWGFNRRPEEQVL